MIYLFLTFRSNKPEYKLKAEQVIEFSLDNNEGCTPDLICLYGRIYKDKFVESNFKDKNALQYAIYWYRKGYEIQPNLHAGVNLTTLLLVSGNEFSKSKELQNIGTYILLLILLINSITNNNIQLYIFQGS